ncbi:cache domain-containing protein [Acuticoccus mangrovi]|uniref:Cache domain-containing protein n=1 Tax=Acuticoccus mangrovi TaxID=2796142 RepID=A0A934IH34_9HYPH|nr:cache domain-containing protein [Acuticoccus mangrovi]MBJ3776343.1 cache domain-containing protein [Acuticoccus mangrovi]
MGKLSLTLLVVLFPLLAASLALGAYLNYASVRNSYIEMVGTRMQTVARRVASDAQVALSMGMPLAGQNALERLLTREAAADPMIRSVDVVAADGTVLFSSDPVRRGTREQESDPMAERRMASIVSAFDTTEGLVVTRASRPALDAALARAGGGILTVAVAALSLAALAIAIVVVLAVRGLTRRLTDRAATAAGEEVPAEMVPVIAEIDEAHAAIRSRWAASRPPATGS